MTKPCDEPAPEYARARRLLAQGRIHRTLEVLRIANERCASSRHRGWSAEVEALAELGRHEAARELARQILESDRDPAAHSAARAALDLVKRRTSPAASSEQAQAASRQRLETAQRLFSEAENLVRRAGAPAAAARYGQARDAYEAAWLARPPNGQALFAAGHCALAQGQPAAAQRLFDRALWELEREAKQPVELVTRVSQIDKHVNSSRLLAWSSRDDQLAVAERNRVGLVSATQAGALNLFTAARVSSLSFEASGSFIFVGSEDGRLELWSTLDGTLLWSVDTRPSPVTGLAFAPEGRSVFVASANGYLQVVSRLDGERLPGLGAAAPEPWGAGGGLSDIAVSADGALLALAGSDSIYLWDLNAKRQVATLGPHDRAPRTVAISDDGELVASTARDGKTRIWHWKTGKLLATLPGNDLFDASVAFLAGTEKALITSSTKVRIWEPTTGRLLRVFGDAHGGELAISPKAGSIATMPLPNAISIWSAASGTLERQLELPRVTNESQVRLCRVGTRFFAAELCAERAKPLP